jgi:hypothetical protein
MTLREEVQQAITAQVSAKAQASIADQPLNGVIESKPFDPNIKLTHEELFSLPEELQMQYFKANGGVLAVMRANGYGLTDEDIDDFHRYKEKRDNELAALPWEEALKRIYGNLPR